MDSQPPLHTANPQDFSQHLHYDTGKGLMMEGVALQDIAQAVGTPSYVYSRAEMQDAYHRFTTAFAGQDVHLCYAVKANSNIAVLQCFGQMGAGADIVSGGEMQRALKAGIPADKIVFSGVGKSVDELAAALDADIAQINIESLAELKLLSEIANSKNKIARIAIRINPDVDAETHELITTGRKEDKFGIDFDNVLDVYQIAAGLPGIQITGIATHIGSQLLDLEPCERTFKRIAMLVHALRDGGHDISHIDLGGGLGIRYKDEIPPSMSDYAAMVKENIGPLNAKIMLEPGRALVGNAGVLLCKTLFMKEGLHRRYAILDTAMNDLIRPSLYQAYHEIIPVAAPLSGHGLQPADIVGPICETGDTFAKKRMMPDLQGGDLVAMLSAGAYGFVMASRYNTRPMPAEVLVDGDLFHVFRDR